MLTCREAVHLISEDQDRPLTKSQRMKLRMHLLVCGWCSRYRSQIETLRKMLLHRAPDDTDAEAELPATARERIRAALREEN